MSQDKASNSRKKLKVINYGGRDFGSIRANLLDYVKRYYPDTYKDFNTAGFGSLVLDTVSYVGDVLSFYLDYQVNENFLDTAGEYDNVVKIARQLGYKYSTSFSSVGEAQFFISVPADTLGAPDERYMPLLRSNSTFTATGGQQFTLVDDIDFSNPSNQIVSNIQDPTTGATLEFAVKGTGRVISGRIVSQTVTLGDFVKFRKVVLNNAAPTDIINVYDAQGNRYYEVEHLAQEIVFKAIRNVNDDKNTVPAILKAIPVTRRFVLERTRDLAYLQFGYGSEDALTNEAVIEPSKIVLKLHGRDYTTQQDFDPTNLTETDKFGVAPSNTTLTIVYRVNDSGDVNIASKALNSVGVPILKYNELQSLNSSTVTTVNASLEVSNENPITGDIAIPSTDELKQRVFSYYASQNRAVTIEDYKAITYAMPPKFGAIKLCSVERDFDALRRNLNMYVISTNKNGHFVTTNHTVKTNLKTWLGNYKMINDSLDILPAKVVNFGIKFSIVADYEENRFNALNLAMQRLQNFYETSVFDINESMYIVDIYKELHKAPGVIDVLDVQILPKVGGVYSDVSYNFNANLSNDGRYLNSRIDTVFELKYPFSDIQGTVT
jgi:hypothetical protein